LIRQMPVILFQRIRPLKLKFSAQMLWKNIWKNKPVNKINLNQLQLHKIQEKIKLKIKKILVKAQINIQMMILIQYQEVKAKWWIFLKLLILNKFSLQVLICKINKFHQRLLHNILKKKISFHKLKLVSIHSCQKMKEVILETLENGHFKEIWKMRNFNYKNKDIKLHLTRMNWMS
jgi:hypothetical protein